MSKKIAVLGAGSFGTCLANQLAKNTHQVTMIARSPEVVESVNKNNCNSRYFSEINLHPNLVASQDFANLADFEFIILATPTQSLRSVLANFPIDPATVLVSAAKGIELNSLLFPSQIIKEADPQIDDARLVVLSGPSFAVEVLEGTPTAVSIASRSVEAAKKVQEIFHSPHFRTYRSKDPLGLEICGALKNVIAIAAGCCSGFGYGANSHAALVTRGLSEILSIGMKLGADPTTFIGLGGVGDLFLTCSSDKSRNFQVGLALAKGLKKESLHEFTKTTAEGVATTKAAYELSKKLGTKTSIIDAVHEVLYRKVDVFEVVKNLLNSAPSQEFHILR